MVKIEYGRVFRKNFKRRISPNQKLLNKYRKRLALFIKNRKNLALRDHRLLGRFGENRVFSVTGDIRVIYREIEENHFEFLDIGTHAQVYGM